MHPTFSLGLAALTACAPAGKDSGIMAAPADTSTGDVRAAGAGPFGDTPRQAQGRRTLSTAFVRLGAGETLAVTLRDGQQMTLRDVAMQRRAYCGIRAAGSGAGTRFCGDYADVAAARTEAPAH